MDRYNGSTIRVSTLPSGSPSKIAKDSAHDIETAAYRLNLLLKSVIEKIDRTSDLRDENREAVDAIECFVTCGIQFANEIIAANETVITFLRSPEVK